MKKNILIAVTVIASLCLLYWGIEFVKGVNMFKPANFYYAEFKEVDGLVEAAPINVNGFPVGQVREIIYDYSTNQIKVMMAMNKNLKVPHGSTVTLSSSLTGASSLDLTLGSENTFYKVGDVIPSVKPGGVMTTLSDEVVPQVVNIIPKVDSIMGGVNSIVSNPALGNSLYRLDAITAQLALSSQQLTKLLTQINSQVPGVMGDVKVVASNLNATTGNLHEMSESIKSLPLDSTVNQLNSTIANIQELSKKLNNENSNLGLLLNDKSLYNNANRALADLDSLLIDIKAHPKRYINIKVF